MTTDKLNHVDKSKTVTNHFNPYKDSTLGPRDKCLYKTSLLGDLIFE